MEFQIEKMSSVLKANQQKQNFCFNIPRISFLFVG